MIKNYYIHKDGIDKPVAKLTIHETLEFKKEYINMLENNGIYYMHRTNY